MTNNEILHATLLDIIFDNRNKEYGAYALRREYNHRLVIAMGIGLSLALLIVVATAMSNKNSIVPPPQPNEGYIVEVDELPKEKRKEPEMIKPKSKPAEPVATKKITSGIEIKPDEIAVNNFPPVDEMDLFKPSDLDRDGKKPGIIPVVEPVKPGNGTEIPKESDQKPKEGFIPNEKNPRFPGGQQALQEFFARNLVTPDELEAGDKKTVQIRFRVDKDGTINSFEIVVTGGSEFDREVIRVCRKMPRWEPAVQNGTNVSVTYLLPVTFIGAEQ